MANPHDYREIDWEKKFQNWKSLHKKNIDKSKNKAEAFYESPIRYIPKKLENIVYKMEKINIQYTNPKIKVLLIVLAYLIPILLLASLLFYIFQPFGFEGKTYTIKIGKSDTNSNKPFYLDETTAKRSLSKPIEEEDKTYREVISQRPFNLIFKPDVVIPDLAKATLQLQFEGKNSDIFINNQLIFPGLLNYSLLKSFSDQEVYIRNDLLPYVKTLDESQANAKDIIIANFPGSTVYSTIPIILENPTLENYQKIDTTLNSTFRDSLNLVVYGKDINLKLIKQDLNWYEGEDTYTITVKDINKNIIHTQIFEDDGNFLNDSKRGNEQNFEINLEGQTPKGIYFLEFQKDKNNKASDSTLKTIKFNTNKILVTNNFLPWQPLTIYTENHFPKNINFFYWWQSKNQNILIRSGDIFKVELNESHISTKYPYLLEPGNYSLELEKGYLWIYNNFVFSLKREHLFQIPLIIQDTKNNPDFIIIDKSLFQDNTIILHHDIEINKEGNSTQIKLINPETTKFIQAKLEIQ